MGGRNDNSCTDLIRLSQHGKQRAPYLFFSSPAVDRETPLSIKQNKRKYTQNKLMWTLVTPKLIHDKCSSKMSFKDLLCRSKDIQKNACKKILVIKGELRRKMNLWSNETSVPSRLFSEICFHDNRM